MPSFEIFYDGDDDFLEVTFASYDETFSRSFALNDHIILHTDLACAAAWGIRKNKRGVCIAKGGG